MRSSDLAMGLLLAFAFIGIVSFLRWAADIILKILAA